MTNERKGPALSPAQQRAFEKVTTHGGGQEDLLAEITKVRQLLKESPGNEDLREWLAFKLYCNHEYDEAIEIYVDLLGGGRENVNIHFYLANAYYKRNNVVAAVENWRWVCEHHGDTGKGRKAKARLTKATRELGNE